MTQRILRAAAVLATGLIAPGWAGEVVTLKGLRDGTPLNAEAIVPEPRHWQGDRDTIPREYAQQPPLIPHGIEFYAINLKFNQCLMCHSWANYKTSGAVKISLTHFSDRDGHDLAHVAARRYVCTQCHVSQMEVTPPVGNAFRPADTFIPREEP